MKRYSTIHVDVSATEILERPGLLARLHSAVAGPPDLAASHMRVGLDATTIVVAARQGLAELGATNAISLTIDELILFQDCDRHPDDLGDLFLTFHKYAHAIDTSFRALRLAVEHAEAGVHYVIEVQARTEHPKGEPAVRIVISGRIAAFEPRVGENAAKYRNRVAPLLQEPMTVERARVAFDSFVERARDAMARAMPDLCCKSVPPEAQPPTSKRPEDPGYDPHEAHYPNPMLGMFRMAMLGTP